MSKTGLLVILLLAGIFGLIFYLLVQDERPPGMDQDISQVESGEGSKGSKWSGYVYWDERGDQLAFRPCGEGVPKYALLDQGVKNDPWSDLVEELRTMPYVPRFIVLAGEESGTQEEGKDKALRIFHVRRIDPQGNCKEDRIVITTPLPGEKIDSPLIIKGQARGSWFFEGDFPVLLTNWDGLIIAQGIASAQGEWMTEDFVPFICRLRFDRPSFGQRGTLILRKDNPSDNSTLDDALEIPIRFEVN
ncbi:MAG: Gmad2 immunoglobulin-like domain-containing protein [Desulfovermiculus sp.]|nr:Gmad2 immunoglobulin-like domain-containing protein [Desulfovermiculus sp.]